MAERSKISILMVLPPLVFASLAVLFYLGMQRDDPGALPSTRVGQRPPEMTVTTLGSLPGFDQAVLRAPGVKLVNFWASWCAPCRAEHPNLQKMAEEGIAIYGINYKDDPEKAQRFLAELGNPFKAVMADESGRTGIDWGIYGVPETFVIDGEGRITFRFAGPIVGDALEKKIRPAIEAAR